MVSETCLSQLTYTQRQIYKMMQEEGATFTSVSKELNISASAVRERNFNEMSDIYNEVMRYDNPTPADRMDKYVFTEVLDGYIIKFPLSAKNVIHAIGKDFYYVLTDDYILYDADIYLNEDDTTDIVLDSLKSMNVEAAKVELTGDTIAFTSMAIKTLKLSVGDIIEIDFFDNESFELSKFGGQLVFE